jgi:hypothetical protein
MENDARVVGLDAPIAKMLDDALAHARPRTNQR